MNLLRSLLSLKYSLESLTLINLSYVIDSCVCWAFSEIDSDTDILTSLWARLLTESAVVSY